jgi:hypothetical protein
MRPVRLSTTVSAVALLAAGAAPARADREARHLGVQLRALAGPGYAYAWQDLGPDGTSTVEGFAVTGNIALGAMVGEALALNMDLVLARSPDASYGVLDSTTFTAVHLGFGVTYWLMPANVYLAASLGPARTSVQNAPVRFGVEIPTSDASDVGVGAHFGFGKLWWLDRRWGLGASFSLALSTAENELGDARTNRTLVAPTLALSTTFH